VGGEAKFAPEKNLLSARASFFEPWACGRLRQRAFLVKKSSRLRSGYPDTFALLIPACFAGWHLPLHESERRLIVLADGRTAKDLLASVDH